MIRRAAVCVVIGVVVSAVSVVLCTTFGSRTYITNLAPTERDHADWQRLVPPGTTRVPVMVRGTERAGRLVVRRVWGIDGTVDYTLDGTLLQAPAGTGYSRMQYVEAGWPLRCANGMRWEPDVDITKPIVWVGDNKPGWGGTAEHVGALPYVRPKRLGGPDLRLLPFRPIGWAFAVNVGFYALIAFGTLATFSGLRRARRHARGRCPACGYRLKDAVLCPECGNEG